MSRAKSAPKQLATVSIDELATLSPHQLSEYIFQYFSLEKILQCLRLTSAEMESVATRAPTVAKSVVVGRAPPPPLPPRPTASSIAASSQTASTATYSTGGGTGAGAITPAPCVDCGKPCTTGQCEDCEYNMLFGRVPKAASRVQRAAANKNIYLTTARPSKSGVKYLGYRFGANSAPKWELKAGKPVGRWMTEKQILGSSFGTWGNVTEDGYVNFFKLNQLYPKTKAGDIPLIRMNPMMFGYVKNYQNQLYPLGKNAFFKGVHRGVTSNLSEIESKQIAGFGPKRKSCFGTITPNEWVQTKTAYGNADVGMIPTSVLGFRGTQGPYTGVTGVAGYPSKGAASPLPSFGKKRKRRSIQKAASTIRHKKTIGSLRAYVKRVIGASAFTRNGTIKNAVLRDLKRDPPSQAIAKKVNFAINVKGSSLKKKKLSTDAERKAGKGIQFDAFGRRKRVATKQIKRAKGGRKASYGKKR